MDVHRFREDERHDDVAIEDLHHEVECAHPVEVLGQAVLYVGDDQHGDGDDGRADVGDKYGEADHEAQEQAVLQVEDVEGDVGDKPDDEDFAEFAPNVVADLDVHFRPDVADDLSVFWQEAPPQPAEDERFILEEEEDEQRHEDDVHQRLDDDKEGVEDFAGERFAVVADFAVDAVQQVFDVGFAEGVGEFLRQQQQFFLGEAEVVRQSSDEQFGLSDDVREEDDAEVEDSGDKEGVNEGDGKHAAHAVAFEFADDAFEQVGQRDGYDDREEPFAEEVEDGEKADAEGDEGDQRRVVEEAEEGGPEGGRGGVHGIRVGCEGKGAEVGWIQRRRRSG